MDDDEPKPGDLIEIFRGAYQHWAIYVGDGYVIHLTTASEAGSNSTMSVLHDKGIVKKENLLDVVCGNTYRINNLLDKTYEPRSVSDILKEARSRVGQELPYSVTGYNCEHFVTGLRYGKPESRQVRDKSVKGVIGAGIIAAILAFLYGLGRKSRRNHDQNS